MYTKARLGFLVLTCAGGWLASGCSVHAGDALSDGGVQPQALSSRATTTPLIPSEDAGPGADGGHTPDEMCTPFETEFFDRAAMVASAVARSPGFEACMRERVGRYHIPDWRDHVASTQSARVTDLLARLRSGAHISGRCYGISDEGFSSSPQGGPAYADPWSADDQKDFDIRRALRTETYAEQLTNGTYGQPGEPWRGFSDTFLHELSHAYGYYHPSTEGDCYNGCSGTALGCNTFGNMASCNAQRGCNWSGTCQGSALSCDSFGWGYWGGTGALAACSQQSGCTWNTLRMCGLYPNQPDCGWTELCGGLGTPPPDASQSIGASNHAAWAFGAGEDGYVFSLLPDGSDPDHDPDRESDPSMPYIITACANQIVYESAQECPAGLFTGCNADTVRLLPTWTGGTTQDFSGTCSCVPSGRSGVSFQTANGRFLHAEGGGGSLFNAATTNDGPHEQFYLVDFFNWGDLVSGDFVRMRTWESVPDVGYFTGAVGTGATPPSAAFTSPSTSMQTWQIYRVDPATGNIISGSVFDGNTVALRSVGRSRYLRATGGGGSTLSTDQTTIGTFERFVMRQPRRAQLVQIQAPNGDYIRLGNGAITLSTTPLEAETVAATCLGGGSCGLGQREAMEQSFWILDHDGGAIRNNDTVSFEQGITMAYWTTAVSGTGAVRDTSYDMFASSQRFQIQRVAGTGNLQHNDQVRIFALGPSRWLRQSSGQILADQTTSAGGSIFVVRFAQARDVRGASPPYLSTPRFSVF